jgi:hypothetical protein
MVRTEKTQDTVTRLAPPDVLAGRVVQSAQERIRPIHEVNPTGPDATRRDAERWYSPARPNGSTGCSG